MSGHNNLIKLALWESLQIDPSLSKFDLMVSIGTGTRKYPKSPRAASFHHVLFDDFIPQLWWAYMFSFDDESNFRDVVNSLNQETWEDYKQLNIFLLSNKLTIDNTSQMGELHQLMHLDPQMVLDCKETVYVLLMATFYFELSSILSEFPRDQVSCVGMICCCLPGEVIVELLEWVHPSCLSFVTKSKTLGHYHSKRDLCLSCRWYQKHVDFTVWDLGQLMSIYAQSARKPQRRISAFPQTMQWFIDQQCLDCPFGTAYHRNLKHYTCKSCSLATHYELKRQPPGSKNQPESRKKPRLY